MIFSKEAYEKKFCIFDELSIPVYELPEADLNLKRILSYHPIRNKETLYKNNIKFEKNYLYDPSRDIIETDRTGFRHYDRIYTHYISKFKDKKINLLEIGIEYGYGLLAWSRYFENANVYGIEKNILKSNFNVFYDKIRKKFPNESNRISFDLGNSKEEDFWKKRYENLRFDVIIDDGGHGWDSCQFPTANNGMNYLKDKNCYYFIEDVKIEFDSLDSINKIYDQLNWLKNTFCFKEFIIYRHINPGRYFHVNLPKDERLKAQTEIEIKRRDDIDYARFLAIKKTDLETGNYYNYMIVFSK